MMIKYKCIYIYCLEFCFAYVSYEYLGFKSRHSDSRIVLLFCSKSNSPRGRSSNIGAEIPKDKDLVLAV